MKESATKEMKPPARDNRAIRIKSVKAAETRRKSSQKHSAVSAASAMRPSKKCAVSRNNLVVGPRVIPINRSPGSAASRQQSLHSERSSRQSYRAPRCRGRRARPRSGQTAERARSCKRDIALLKQLFEVEEGPGLPIVRF